ncbi:Homeobox-leucine zipper protein ATHB-7 [Sesamum alatum]|uniref:Homeobox-leucine zipper protein n=1 Tax=Sesamum alatum TaxID=300844 RepID=A0AAE1XPR1_9LAMI|nr:Homeobox-leucine zipper protein ATHB-7 [Sesamum alatum]
MSDGVENSCFSNLNTMTKKKKSKNYKRRFSDEQIRSLEVMFESESKLEPKKKAELANELGLQPRQVAIWFQNKRARWKSKHIEKEYTVLLSNYNNLASQIQTLKEENQSLLIKLQNLKNEMVGKSECEIQETSAAARIRITDGESDDSKMRLSEVKSRCLEEMLSDDDSSIRPGLFGVDEENDELLKLVEPAAAADSSLTSAEDWGSLDSDHDLIINQPNDDEYCCYQWWDFWS